MRSYRMTKAGSLDDLKIVEEAVPVPGPGQVLIRVRATALNFRDLALLTGMIPAPIKPDVVPLSDAAGEIVGVGPGVTRFAPGDHVINSFFPEWFGGNFDSVSAAAQYSTNVDGWLTEYRVVGAEAVIRAPDGLSFEEAATLVCSGVTAWTALAGVRAGDIVLTQGTGGVSIFAAQIAKALGARVIATTSSSDKSDRLRALGADEIIHYDTDPEWGATARGLTDRGVDRVVDTVGAPTFAQSLKAVAAGGQVSMVGMLGRIRGRHRLHGDVPQSRTIAGDHHRQPPRPGGSCPLRRAHRPEAGNRQHLLLRRGARRDRASRSPSGVRQGRHPAPSRRNQPTELMETIP